MQAIYTLVIRRSGPLKEYSFGLCSPIMATSTIAETILAGRDGEPIGAGIRLPWAYGRKEHLSLHVTNSAPRSFVGMRRQAVTR